MAVSVLELSRWTARLGRTNNNDNNNNNYNKIVIIVMIMIILFSITEYFSHLCKVSETNEQWPPIRTFSL